MLMYLTAGPFCGSHIYLSSGVPDITPAAMHFILESGHWMTTSLEGESAWMLVFLISNLSMLEAQNLIFLLNPDN